VGKPVRRAEVGEVKRRMSSPEALECYNELQARSAKIDRLRARLDAIASCYERATWHVPEFAQAARADVRVLARGTPRRELERCLSRWSKKEKR
jgi:hypothetical protein